MVSDVFAAGLTRTVDVQPEARHQRLACVALDENG
jgi:hypothetical protein